MTIQYCIFITIGSDAYHSPTFKTSFWLMKVKKMELTSTYRPSVK